MLGNSIPENLNTATFLYAGIACLVIVLCLRPILYFSSSPIKGVPGPFLAKYTRLWELLSVVEGNFHQKAIDLHKKYGPVVRISPNKYDFDSVEAVKIIYSLTKTFPKSAYYEAFADPHRKTLFNCRDVGEHSKSRRSMASLYTMTTMRSYEFAVDNQTAVLQEKMMQLARDKKKVSLPQLLQLYAFDVIGEITFGKSFSLLHNESSSPYFYLIDMLDKTFWLSAKLGILPELWPSLLKILQMTNATSPVALNNIAIEQLDKFRRQENEESWNEHAEPFIAKVIKLEKEGKMTNWDAVSVCANNIVAGSDTTAITLNSALYHIYTNEQVLTRLRQELNILEGEGKISNPITFQEAQSIPYLQAIVKEAMRVHPAVGVPLARTVPEGGQLINGIFFPEGTEVGVNAWALNYNKDVYGPDADQFNPDRWLISNPKVEMNSTISLFAFGAGSRTCIGKNISLLEMYKVLPQIVRNFDIHIDVSARPWKLACSWFVKQTYLASLTPRQRV